jgi:hypothetical protein
MRIHSVILRSLGLIALCAAVPARADTDNAETKAVVVAPLSFVNVQEIDFGAMLAGPTAGTVTISPAGVRTKTGGVTLTGGAPQAARFAGQGAFNQFVSISLTSNTYTMTRIGGTQTMTFSTFVIGSTPTAPITTTPRTFRIASPTGIFNFPLGATLNVAANQTPGSYKGQFTVILNYQ